MKCLKIMAVWLWAVPTFGADAYLSLTRSSLPAANAPTNIEVITSEDFQKTSARTVGDALIAEPGVVIQKIGSEGSQISPMIRGFSAKQVLIVIDDVPQTPDLTGNVDLSRIPLENVDRIEVLRGGGSAVYGPNAEGGIIHIITKHPVSAADILATSEAGSYDTYHNRFQVGTSQGPLQAQITGSRDLSNGFQQNATAYNTALTGFFAYDTGRYGRFSYNIEGSKGKVGLPSGTPIPISDWNGTLERQANDLTGRQIETDRNNRLQYTNRIHDIDVTTRLANNVKDLNSFQFGSETLIRTEGRNAFTKVELPGMGALGYEYYQRRLDSNVYGVHRGDAWGSFLEAYLFQNNWIHLTPGVRYDYDNIYQESWSPRVLVVITPDDRWKVSASAARSFQAPTFGDLYNPFVLPQDQSPNLRPETTWTYDLGFEVKPATGLVASVSFFYADTKDRIAYDSTKNFAAYNLDRAFSQGFEATIAYDYKIFSQRLGYSYLQAEGQNTANGDSAYRPLAFNPKYKINYRADVRLPRQVTATADFLYVARQWTNIDQSGIQIPGYAVVNLKLSKAVGWAELYIACNNVLDRHYAETADSFNGFFPQPGRNYLGGITVHFLK